MLIEEHYSLCIQAEKNIRDGLCTGVHMVFFFKQKTAYEVGTGDWSSDVCSSDLRRCSRGDEEVDGDGLEHSEGLRAGVLPPLEGPGGDRKSVV